MYIHTYIHTDINIHKHARPDGISAAIAALVASMIERGVAGDGMLVFTFSQSCAKACDFNSSCLYDKRRVNETTPMFNNEQPARSEIKQPEFKSFGCGLA